MDKVEVYLAWAPKDSIWSPWVVPVAFAQMNCGVLAAENTAQQVFALPRWLQNSVGSDQAYVLDLPGRIVAKVGLQMARLGIRPVPLIDGSPCEGEFYAGALLDATRLSTVAPSALVDMSELLRAFCASATELLELHLPTDAMPAFLLDADRMFGHRLLTDEMYDNRWRTFPQDFPSAKFLLEHGVRRVMLVQERNGQPQEDLAHVLLRWQEAGIEIESAGMNDESLPERIVVAKPTQFRSIWYRALAILGLRRHWSGGFGGFPGSTSG